MCEEITLRSCSLLIRSELRTFGPFAHKNKCKWENKNYFVCRIHRLLKDREEKIHSLDLEIETEIES